jgi:sialic acid synthase SpsE
MTHGDENLDFEMSHGSFAIAGRNIGPKYPTFFIADIASNHDGELARAIDLIHLAVEAGADAAKFQHFRAETIVSDFGFQQLGSQKSHQASWEKSVFEVYQKASVNLDWTPYLKTACDQVGILFFTSPYDLDLVDAVDPYVPAHKIGSGDITWLEIVEHVASKNKPYILSTGASTMQDVDRAVQACLEINPQLALLQCNTNYTGDRENFHHVQLNVLSAYRHRYPDLVLGLSDHTPGHTTVLGGVALGARIIEKHFTDDVTRVGPDHAFSMDPSSWREMVDRTRELEVSLGTGLKQVEANETDTVVLQRRAVRAAGDLPIGTKLVREHITMLRPCPPDAIPPYEAAGIYGKILLKPIKAGDHIRWTDLK